MQRAVCATGMEKMITPNVVPNRADLSLASLGKLCSIGRKYYRSGKRTAPAKPDHLHARIKYRRNEQLGTHSGRTSADAAYQINSI